MIAAGATITHHHAVGTDHQPWLAQEIGPVGVSVLRAVKAEPRPDRDPQPRGADPVTGARAFAFLVNPASGGGAAPEAVVPVARRLREAGATVEVTYSPGPRAMRWHWSSRRSPGATWSSRSVATGWSPPWSDRSPGSGAPSAWSPPAAATTSRGCSGSPRTRDAQADLLLSAAPREVDLLAWSAGGGHGEGGGRRLVAGSVYAGVDARAAEIVDRARLLPRRCSTRTPPCAPWLTYQPGHYRLSVDGGRDRARRGHCRGGELRATTARACRSPRTHDLADGLLDVVVIEAASRRTLVRALPSVYAGAHVERPEVSVFRGARIELAGDARTPIPVGGDGEPLAPLPGLTGGPAIVEVVPGALRVLAGPRG